MRKKRPSSYVNKTDLRLPGQKVIVDGHLSNFNDLFTTDGQVHPQASNSTAKPVVERKKDRSWRKFKPQPPSDSDSGWVNMGAGKSSHPLTPNPAQAVLMGAPKRLRELILRIGRPRQP